MDLRPITEDQKKQYNALVTHVIQSWEWGEFRKGLGLPLLRYGIYKDNKLVRAFQLTLHKIPLVNQYVGYLPKGPLPDKELAQALEQIRHHAFISEGKKLCFIKIEPDILANTTPYSIFPNFLPSPKPLFSKFNFLLDLTKSEEELLKNMHPKTRYNIRLAQKKGATVEERTDDKALAIYLRLYFETTLRQGYHGHNRDYHKKVWQALKDAGMARFLIAFYDKKPLTAWMLLNFKDKLYYAYGGSSTQHKEVMSNNLIAWEAIRLGQKLKLKEFDMWGALGPTPDPKDPWYGFHKFKAGYGGQLLEYIGTFDLVFNNTIYWFFTVVDKLTPLKVFLLRLIGK